MPSMQASGVHVVSEFGVCVYAPQGKHQWRQSSVPFVRTRGGLLAVAHGGPWWPMVAHGGPWWPIGARGSQGVPGGSGFNGPPWATFGHLG